VARAPLSSLWIIDLHVATGFGERHGDAARPTPLLAPVTKAALLDSE